jgi:hypothetical protein
MISFAYGGCRHLRTPARPQLNSPATQLPATAPCNRSVPCSAELELYCPSGPRLKVFGHLKSSLRFLTGVA